jgi:hypothetical protein
MKSGRFLNLPLFLWLPGIRNKARVRLRESSQRHETVANAVLGNYSSEDLKITGVEINQKDDLILTSAAYGAGMTLDLLCELKTKELLELQDAVMFVGSMGSFNGVGNLRI